MKAPLYFFTVILLSVILYDSTFSQQGSDTTTVHPAAALAYPLPGFVPPSDSITAPQNPQPQSEDSVDRPLVTPQQLDTNQVVNPDSNTHPVNPPRSTRLCVPRISEAHSFFLLAEVEGVSASALDEQDSAHSMYPKSECWY